MWPLTGPKYPTWMLGVYEAWVVYVASPVIFQCSTTKHLLPLHTRNLGHAHCDVGVGSGFYLAKTSWPEQEEEPNSLTLIDIEKAPLSVAAKRISSAHPELPVRTQLVDILLSDTATVPDAPFDSLSLMYVLHTLHVPIHEKVMALGRLAKYVKADGIVFGATVLGKTKANHGLAARILISVLVAGTFLQNADDDADSYRQALEQNFNHVDSKTVGSIFIFEARGPKQGAS